MASATVWCLLIDHENKPVGNTFEVLETENIARFKKRVKEEKMDDLKGISADQLVVWRYEDPTFTFDDEDSANLEQQVSDVFSSKKIRQLGHRWNMEDLKLEENETLLVKAPYKRPKNYTNQVWYILIDHENKPLGKMFKVAVDKDIADLKEVIKEEKLDDLQGISADQLVVWRYEDPTFTFDDEDSANLEQQLSDVFSGKKIRQLGHRRNIEDLKLKENETLLVKVPYKRPRNDINPVWYILIDHENKPLGKMFKVAVDKDIADLKKRVKEEKVDDLRGISADLLVVWRTKEPKLLTTNEPQLPELIDAIDFTDKAKVDELASSTEVMNLQLADKEVLVVQAPNNRGTKRKREEDEARALSCLGRLTNHAPSSLAKPSDFRQYTKHLVAVNRPFQFDNIPITLLQQHFGEFIDDCKQMPNAQTQEFVLALTTAACEWYAIESARRTAVQRVFQSAGLQLHCETIPGTEYKTDGNTSVDIMPAVIRECKNEVGGTSALFEAAVYYANFLHLQVRTDLKGKTCFPSILMLDVGPIITFYGCLWTGLRIFVEPLAPWYDLTTNWNDEPGRQAIAATLSAFMNTTASLRRYYEEVSFLQVRDCTYPYPTSYDDENGNKIWFQYTGRVHDKLVFTAECIKGGDRIIVKFTRRYSSEAHFILMQSNNAPRLRAVIPIAGGWIMVVMDYSPYPSLADVRFALPVEARNKVSLKITDSIKQLHGRSYVHGDIRDVNIHIDHEALARNEEFIIHVLDLDWAGKIGEARYPPRINTKSVARPEGVTDGAIITTTHDLEMIQKLF